MIVSRSYIGAAIRASVFYALHGPAVKAVFGVALIGLGLFGSTAFALSSAAPANAASSSVCKPDTSYQLPSALSLASKPNGLTYINDGTSYYHVGGSSVTAIRQALHQCAPALTGTGDYLAYTSYNVSWSYAIWTGKNNVCTLSNVKVGLHVSQLLPSLLITTTTSQPIKTKWNGFIGGMHAHEDGHTAIDVAQAKSLLVNLQNLKGSCATIAASAQQLTSATTNALVTANTEHDTDTDYGRDQGAIF